MKYPTTQSSRVVRQAFAGFCDKFRHNWLANWNKYYMYHDREEPDPALPVGPWLEADSHDKVEMPYDGNNLTARQKHNRTNNAYGRLHTSQGTRSDRQKNDHITMQSRNRIRGRENDRFGEQDYHCNSGLH
jgi:hypothetical protein